MAAVCEVKSLFSGNLQKNVYICNLQLNKQTPNVKYKTKNNIKELVHDFFFKIWLKNIESRHFKQASCNNYPLNAKMIARSHAQRQNISFYRTV